MRYFISLIVIAIIGILIFTAFQKNAPSIETDQTSAAPKAPAQVDEAPRISLADAKKDFDAGNVVIIDTRPETAYKQEHIKDSINVSTDMLEAKFKEIPTDKKIIAYCS